MKPSYRKVEFTHHDFCPKAFEVYSNSSFTFYKYIGEDCYLVADKPNSWPYEIGTLKDVEEYLLEFAD